MGSSPGRLGKVENLDRSRQGGGGPAPPPLSPALFDILFRTYSYGRGGGGSARTG